MAKRSLLGVMTGKLGNMVGQSNSLVSSKDKQVWRVYNGNVKNPKTIRQAAQRSLFVAVKNFQQAFAEILDHSWQGVDYGTKSLNHFRSMVLANGGANFPGFFYQPKGAQNFFPQPWPISRGSININTKLVLDDINVLGTTWLSGYVPAWVPTDHTKGEAWAEFLKNNPQFMDGDMITCVALVKEGFNWDTAGTYLPVVDRYIIDTKDTTPLTSEYVTSQDSIFKAIITSDDRADSFNPKLVKEDDLNLIAGGIIISRQNGSKASWLRSKSDLYLNYEWVPGDEERNAWTTLCLDTFMNSDATAESDWYLNQTGENEDESGSVGPTPTPVQLSVESRAAALDPEGSVNAAYVLNGSQSGYLVYGGKYFHLSDTELTATSFVPGTDFADSVVRLILTETLQAQIEAAGYSFIFPIEPDNP